MASRKGSLTRGHAALVPSRPEHRQPEYMNVREMPMIYRGPPVYMGVVARGTAMHAITSYDLPPESVARLARKVADITGVVWWVGWYPDGRASKPVAPRKPKPSGVRPR